MMHGIVSRFCIAAMATAALRQTSSGTETFYPLGVYWPHSYVNDFARHETTETWTYVDRVLGELERHHCNFIWVTLIDDPSARRLCELADRHGIQVGLQPEAVHHPRRTRQAATPQAAAAAAKETFETFRDVRGIWGYVLDDEPPIAALPYLEALERELVQLDPTRPVTTVFRRTEAGPAIARHAFGIVTYDNYPFGHERDPNLPNTPSSSRDYFRGITETLGRQCDARGIDFWVMPGAFQEIWGNWYWSQQKTVVAEPGAYLHWRMPTVGETRWQIWESVACGARGVIFFTLWPDRNFERTGPDSPRDPQSEARALSDEAGPRVEQTIDTGQPGALLHVDSTATEQLVAMGETYQDVARLAPTLRGLRFSNIPVVFPSAPFRAQTFRDGQNNYYAVLVNDDTDRPAQATVSVLPGFQNVRDLRAERDLALQPAADFDELSRVANGLQSTIVSLEAGGGTLLRLEADIASRPLAKVVEDFSSPNTIGSRERAEVRITPSDWNVAWNHEVVPSRDARDLPATVTGRVHHNKLSLQPSGPIYVVYQGDGQVELGFSPDGVNFSPAEHQGFNTPIPIPPDITRFRFSLMNTDSSLSKFCTIATETQ